MSSYNCNPAHFHIVEKRILYTCRKKNKLRKEKNSTTLIMWKEIKKMMGVNGYLKIFINIFTSFYMQIDEFFYKEQQPFSFQSRNFSSICIGACQSQRKGP